MHSQWIVSTLMVFNVVHNNTSIWENFRTSRTSACGIIGYSPTTSAVNRSAPSGISPNPLSSSRKSAVSLLYHFPSFITGCKCWSKNSWTFSVKVLQFKTTGRPGTLLSLLCILGKRYNLTLVPFLKLNLNSLFFCYNFFFLSRFSFTTIHKSQDCRRRGRAFL